MGGAGPERTKGAMVVVGRGEGRRDVTEMRGTHKYT